MEKSAPKAAIVAKTVISPFLLSKSLQKNKKYNAARIRGILISLKEYTELPFVTELITNETTHSARKIPDGISMKDGLAFFKNESDKKVANNNVTTSPAAASEGVIKLSQIHLPWISAPLDLTAPLIRIFATPIAATINRALTAWMKKTMLFSFID
jgi:hypothetical protein